MGQHALTLLDSLTVKNKIPMSSSILRDKSFVFAILIIRLVQNLQVRKKEYILSKQILKSGTSIGTQLEESEFAASHADFINKLTVALKEANETKYWLRLLTTGGYISDQQFEEMLHDCKEIIAMLVSSLNTLKKNKKSLRNILLSLFSVFNF